MNIYFFYTKSNYNKLRINIKRFFKFYLYFYLTTHVIFFFFNFANETF